SPRDRGYFPCRRRSAWGSRAPTNRYKGVSSMLQTRQLGAAAVLLALGLTGCAGPRFVSQDQFGGVIAMPSNSDDWPTHYRTKAEQMMARKCPQGYVVVHEEEVIVGQSTVGRDDSDTRTRDIPGRHHSDLEVTSTETTHSTTTPDITDWR